MSNEAEHYKAALIAVLREVGEVTIPCTADPEDTAVITSTFENGDGTMTLSVREVNDDIS